MKGQNQNLNLHLNNIFKSFINVPPYKVFYAIKVNSVDTK